jgi:DNA-binding transcriptional LysR family regulator
MSQPPLSYQIKLLEEEVGTKLIERRRGARHITLTNEGNVLYFRAKSIVEFIDDGFKGIQDIGKGDRGYLRLGMISSCGPLLLPGVIRTFADRHPNIHFHIIERNTYELIDFLENYSIELAFVRTPFDMSYKHNKIVLGREPLVAVGKSHFFASETGTTVSPKFFHEKQVIIYRRWKSVLEKFFERNAIIPVYSCVNDDAKTSLMWALEGHGVAIIPELISRILCGDDMKILTIDAPLLTSEVYAIWQKQKYISPSLQKLINLLTEFEIRPLPGC